jgi:peptidoglycan-binding protein CsiV
MRRLIYLFTVLVTSVLSTSPTWAENPYTALSAPELRTKIARIGAVHEQSWYQVEVLVFARTGPTSPEYWRLDQRPQLSPENAIVPSADSPLLPDNADTIDINAAALGAWRTLPTDQLILIDMLGRMEKRGDYRSLYHAGWVQPLRERNQAFPIYITGGNQVPHISAQPTQDAALDFGLPPIETKTEAGTATNNGNANSDGQIQSAEQNPEQTNAIPEPATQPELQGMMRFYLSRYLHVEPELWLTSTSHEGQAFWVKVDQKRRMRGEELHYLDHPLFGALVRLTPYQTQQQKEVELMKAALKKK